MSLETIVSKMIAANEPESNIAKVIKHYKKIPLKAVAACPDGYELDEFDNCKEISQNTETWQDQEGNYISKEEYNNIEEDGGSGTDFKEELWKNVNKAQQEEKLPQSGIVDLKNYNEGLTPKILDDNLTPNPSNDCGEGYTYIDGRGCVEDVSLDEVVLTQQEQLDDEGNLINKPLPEGMFVEEEEGSSDDLLDDSKKWDDFNREEVLKINLIPALDRNEFIKNFDQKTLNARKSEREAFSKQSAAPIQARYNQNKIQVEVDNKEQISNFLDKLYRDSDMGVYENGQWIVDPNKVDVNSEEFKNKSQENFKI